MASYEKAKEAGDPSPAKSVERMRGYYRCCMYKWAKSRRKENWPLICRACPRIAKKNKELPDILRKFMGVQSKFKSRAPTRDQCEYTNILPPEFEEIVAESVAAGFKNQRKRFFCSCFGSVGFCRYCLSGGGGLENFYLYLDIVIDIYIYVYIYRWWFDTCFTFALTWGDDPIYIIFFNWVETTNQIYIICTYYYIYIFYISFE